MSATKFQNKYRIQSTRHPSWNYANSGFYFVTICTQFRRPYFGKIKEKTMQLSDMGRAAMNYWADIPTHFPRVILDTFIVLPDHVHGLLQLTDISVPVPVETQNFPSPPMPNGAHPPQRQQTLSSVIRGFKIGVTQFGDRNDIQFRWQTRFHDKIVRDVTQLNTIRRYIRNNVLKHSKK